MATAYLEDIMRFHRARAAADRRDWRERLDEVVPCRSRFRAALRPGDAVGVIAEIKRRSPSKGWLSRDLDPTDLSRAYEDGGAAALSVLTDEEHFAGSLGDLRAAHDACTLPLLRKDFTVSANDVIDALQFGASAILLIVAALDDDECARLLEVSAQCGLDALVEVHDLAEARRALALGATLVGVNQRDLRTFEVRGEQAAEVVATLPPTVVAVAESGLRDVSDVERAAAYGFDAVLVGESLVRASDPSLAVRALTGVKRHGRD
ncbi:MAG: indole-3-glycerol phosphate synthase TrpC [Acidimicrobiales bacterium]